MAITPIMESVCISLYLFFYFFVSLFLFLICLVMAEIMRGPMPTNATIGPLLSTGADGIHSNNVRHGPSITSNYTHFTFILIVNKKYRISISSSCLMTELPSTENIQISTLNTKRIHKMTSKRYSLIVSASGNQMNVTGIPFLYIILNNKFDYQIAVSTVYAPGDILRLYDATFSPQGEFTLLSVVPLPRSYHLFYYIFYGILL